MKVFGPSGGYPADRIHISRLLMAASQSKEEMYYASTSQPSKGAERGRKAVPRGCAPVKRHESKLILNSQSQLHQKFHYVVQ